VAISLAKSLAIVRIHAEAPACVPAPSSLADQYRAASISVDMSASMIE